MRSADIEVGQTLLWKQGEYDLYEVEVLDKGFAKSYSGMLTKFRKPEREWEKPTHHKVRCIRWYDTNATEWVACADMPGGRRPEYVVPAKLFDPNSEKGVAVVEEKRRKGLANQKRRGIIADRRSRLTRLKDRLIHDGYPTLADSLNRGLEIGRPEADEVLSALEELAARREGIYGGL